MRKVAVVGNAGAGKSTFAKRLGELTGLPVVHIDIVKFRADGATVEAEDYRSAHRALMMRDAWIIDGYGDMATLWERIDQADTVIFIDLPLFTHHWWVTKRLIGGLLRTPAGWPAGSPMWRSSASSYKTIWLCHRHLTPRYRELVSTERPDRQVIHLRSGRQIASLLKSAAACSPATLSH